MESACSPCVCLGSLPALQDPFTVQKHSCENSNTILTVGVYVRASGCLSLCGPAMTTCPGSPSALAFQQLGDAPADARDPEFIKRQTWKIDVSYLFYAYQFYLHGAGVVAIPVYSCM